MRKTLSICIPTRNRAKNLKRLLAQLESELVGLEAEVEVAVSDNCSSDNTREILNGFSKKLPLRFASNRANLGFDVNVIKCIMLANGEFSWLVGDDDLFVPGAIKKIVSALQSCDGTVGGMVADFYRGKRPALSFRSKEFKIFRKPFNEDDIYVAAQGSGFIAANILRTSMCREIIENNIKIEGSLALKKKLGKPKAFAAIIQTYLTLECLSRSDAYGIFPFPAVQIVGDGVALYDAKSFVPSYDESIGWMNDILEYYPGLYKYGASRGNLTRLLGIASFLLMYPSPMSEKERQIFYQSAKSLSGFYSLNRDYAKLALFSLAIWLHKNFPPTQYIIWWSYCALMRMRGRKTAFERRRENEALASD